MKQFVPILLLLCVAVVSQSACSSKPPTSNSSTDKSTVEVEPMPDTAAERAAKPACATDLSQCPPTGCGTDFDPNLNERKNLTSDSHAPVAETLEWMNALANPTHFVKGGSRTELVSLGEGKNIFVVGYLLKAKPELSGESCNCYLKTPQETDNHLVLVAKAIVDQFPAGSTKDEIKKAMQAREPQSHTAEITPRVRVGHPKWTAETLNPLIDATQEKALLVRISGLLMFDSEHFIEHPLVRINNWEIHPILGLDYCPSGKTCTASSDANWKRLDDQ